MKDDIISRQAAIDALAEHEKSRGHNYSMFVDVVSECAEIIRDIPPVQPEYTEHEENILIMLFKIARLIIDLQGGCIEMADGWFFDDNDLFNLAEKLRINY